MSLESLQEEGLIEKTSEDKEAAFKNLLLAHRDLKNAKDNLNAKDYDWALAIAYNAMLQAGLALMHKQGYIPKGQHRHVAVARFLENVVDVEELYKVFDRYRKKRHRIIYEEAYITTEEEAARAVDFAEEFAAKIEDKIGWFKKK